MFKRALALALLGLAALAGSASASAGWGGLPTFTTGQFMQPYDLAVAHGDGVYVVDVTADTVHKFSLDGDPLWTAGSTGSGPEQLDGPSSVAVHDGIVYVADLVNDRIQKLDAGTGAFVGHWGSTGADGDDTKLMHPFRLDVGGDGTVYVLDTGDKRVKRFSGDGTPLGAWGANGTAPGQFTHGIGLAVDDNDGFVYVVDYHQRRVQKFDADGDHLLEWLTPAGGSPYDPVVEPEGNVLIPDFDHHVVRRYSPNGQKWPVDIAPQGSAQGQVSFPMSVAADPIDEETPLDGHIYVADAGNHRITPFGYYDSDPPTIEIATPNDGGLWYAGYDMYPAWNCDDFFGWLTKCEGEYDGDPIINNEPVPLFPGTHTVTVRAEDPFGNTSVKSHTFTVEGAVEQETWPWDGFHAPVDMGMVNTAKAGSSIPVKFSLGGDRGLDVFADEYPRSVRVPCESGADHDAIEQTATAGGSELSYDAASDTYTYVWKTAKSWSSEPAGPCRQLVVKLDDGSEHRANFRFR